MLFGYSILIDVLWLIVIAWRTWFSEAYDKLAPWEKGLHVTTTVVVFINFVLKVGLQVGCHRLEFPFREQSEAVVPAEVPKCDAVCVQGKGVLRYFWMFSERI